MSDKVRIAIDAMGGENSPQKIIHGIDISLKNNKENYFYLYGVKSSIAKELGSSKILNNHCEIIETKDVISDDESPLAAAKRGKDTSMWKAIESQKENNSWYRYFS